MTALSPLYLRPDSDEGPALLTVPQAARYCNIGKTAAYEMCHAYGPAGWKEFTLRIGAGARGLRVKRADLLRWIDSRCGVVDPHDEALPSSPAPQNGSHRTRPGGRLPILDPKPAGSHRAGTSRNTKTTY